MIAERKAAGALDLDSDADVDAGLAADVDSYGDGCDLTRFLPECASCLTCSLPRCRHDLPQGVGRMLATALAVERLTAAGLDPRAQAAELGVSTKTISRARRLLAAADEVAA